MSWPAFPICISVATNLAPSATLPPLTGIPQANLGCPRRAPQRLRRLAEGADKGAPHPIRVAKPGDLRDAFDRLNGGLPPLARHFDPQSLDRLRRRRAGLGNEGARKMPRT